MAFKKGQSGNPTGRPKGTKNKETKSVKQVFGIIKRNINEVEKEIQEASPEQRRDFMLKLVCVLSENPEQKYLHGTWFRKAALIEGQV